MSKNIEDTQNYYNAIAKGYPELYHKEQENKISTIKHLIPQTGSLLDLGSGAGVLNQFLSKDLEVISFDLSQELLNLNSNKNKIQGDICNLPFKEKSFDTICSFTVIQDVYNIKKAFKEINRIIKNNGLLIISFLKRSNNKELIENLIKENYNVEDEFEEFKDYIYVLRKS